MPSPHELYECEALCVCESAQPEEDAWQYTEERIDFTPIWSQQDFERRATEAGWSPPVEAEER